MEKWRVVWSANELGYELLLLNGIRIAGRMKFENELGEPLPVVRQLARQRAVEWALERRVPLDCVREDRSAG